MITTRRSLEVASAGRDLALTHLRAEFHRWEQWTPACWIGATDFAPMPGGLSQQPDEARHSRRIDGSLPVPPA
jgi:hypothetical protein